MTNLSPQEPGASGRTATRPRSRASHRTLLHGFDLSALVAFALAGCGEDRREIAEYQYRGGSERVTAVPDSKVLFMGGTGVEDEVQDIYDKAALQELLGDITIPTITASAAETSEARRRIAEKRKWVTSLNDPRWRKAYSRWLDYAEQKALDADRFRAEYDAVEKLLAENPPQ